MLCNKTIRICRQMISAYISATQDMRIRHVSIRCSLPRLELQKKCNAQLFFLMIQTVLNILISDLLISSIGIAVDVMAIVGMIGTSLHGRDVQHQLCQFEGFFYMTSGNIRTSFVTNIV